MPQTKTSANNDSDNFPRKVWVAGGIVALIVILALLVKNTVNVLLLVLAGALIAIFFRGLSGLLQKKTGWKEGFCVAISIAGSMILLVLLFLLMGSKIQAQAAQLTEQLPTTIDNAKAQLSKTPIGQEVVKRISSPEAQEKAGAFAQTFFRSTFGILGDVYVILFIGIFFTVSPKMYTDGIIKLVPPAGKNKGAEVLSQIGINLKKWLKGKLFAMLFVFILTAAGLAIMGMPMWLVLALLAGILNFIPNFGPLIAMIPAVLVALLQGPAMAAWVAGLYIVIQVVESNFITPMVQQKLISIPPALIIIAQLLIAPLTGSWGLVLATPVLVIFIVLVNTLYVKKQEE